MHLVTTHLSGGFSPFWCRNMNKEPRCLIANEEHTENPNLEYLSIFQRNYIKQYTQDDVCRLLQQILTLAERPDVSVAVVCMRYLHLKLLPSATRHLVNCI
ncbi:hypothetical protein GOODEAATRI_025646 [Goodea atripinnis]|uniref:Uncharacterized protein n=1 Tax=Goodea atripinnis TaxID=208336 RepID=A0ABV0NZ34_9TELE